MMDSSQIQGQGQTVRATADAVALLVFELLSAERRESFPLQDWRNVLFTCTDIRCNAGRESEDEKSPRRPFKATVDKRIRVGDREVSALWIRREEPIRGDGSLAILCAHHSRMLREEQRQAVVNALMKRAEACVEELLVVHEVKDEAAAWSHPEVVNIIGRATKSKDAAKQVAWAHSSVQGINPCVPLFPVIARLATLIRAAEDEVAGEVLGRENELVTCGFCGEQIPLRTAKSARVFYPDGRMEYVLAALCEDALQEAEQSGDGAVKKFVVTLQSVMDAARAGGRIEPLYFDPECARSVEDVLAPEGWVLPISGRDRPMTVFEAATSTLVRITRAGHKRAEQEQETASENARKRATGIERLGKKLPGLFGIGARNGTLA